MKWISALTMAAICNTAMATDPTPPFAHVCTENSEQIEYQVQFRQPSLFGDVIVVDQNNKRHLRFENICSPDQSSIDLSNRNNVIMEYVRHALVGLGYATQHNNALIVGMGGGVFSNQLAEHIPDIKIDAIEIDPVVTKVAQDYFAVKPNKHYQIHIQDGLEYLQATDKRYDIILLDAYDADGIPEHLATQAFFNLAASKLNSGGVIVANLGLDTPRRYLILAEHLRKASGATLCIHGKTESNLTVIAGKAETLSTVNTQSTFERLNAPDWLKATAKQVKTCPRL